MRLLDYGCGDGLFLNRLLDSTQKQVEVLGFEPYMELMEGNQIRIVRDWSEVEESVRDGGKFDYVTCFEVLEHFNGRLQEEMLHQIRSVLSPSGQLIVSVPIESGIPSVVKNVIRWTANPDDRSRYSVSNIVKSFWGRPIPEYREEPGYLSHMGFYFQDLERMMLDMFDIDEKSYSPFGYLGSTLNSQVFYSLKIKPRSVPSAS